MKHSNIMDHCVVKAVTHTHDPLANASLGMTASPPPLNTPSCVCCQNHLTFCTLNYLIGIGQPDRNANIIKLSHL